MTYRTLCLSSVVALLATSVIAQELLPSTALMGQQANFMYRELNGMVRKRHRLTPQRPIRWL